jgi:hypothetical protein
MLRDNQTAKQIGCKYHMLPSQTAASNIHVMALLRWLEIRPHMDPVDSQRNNLQE